MLRNLLGSKMIEKLTAPIKISDAGIIEITEEQDLSPLFLEMFRSKQLKSPEMIWNQRTRDELKSILYKELEGINSSSGSWEVNPYHDFFYSEHESELRVGNVSQINNRENERRQYIVQAIIISQISSRK
jgi:hypothetical protein